MLVGLGSYTMSLPNEQVTVKSQQAFWEGYRSQKMTDSVSPEGRPDFLKIGNMSYPLTYTKHSIIVEIPQLHRTFSVKNWNELIQLRDTIAPCL